MHNPMSKLSPPITKMIRMDHTHVMALFHKYQADTAPRVKKGLVEQICTAVEVHAQLEEEIFYPALREVATDAILDKSVPEHSEIRRLVTELRGMQYADLGMDRALHTLMQHIMHHVADEETVLLPLAEKLLPKELSDMGARMTRRRLQLMAPRTPELAAGMGRAVTGSTALLVAAGAVLVGGLYLARRGKFDQALRHARRLNLERKMLSRARGILPEPVKSMLPQPVSVFLPKRMASLLPR